MERSHLGNLGPKFFIHGIRIRGIECFPNAAARTSSSRDGAQREDRSERFANLIVSIYPCFSWKNSCVSLLALYPIRRVLCDSLLDK